MQALGFLIDQALMRQFLDRNAKPVPMAEVDRQLAELQAGLRKQGKSMQDFCREGNQTEAQVKATIARHLQWHAFARQQISEADLQQYYRDNKDLFDRNTVRVSHIFFTLPASATESERAQARARLADLRAQIAAGKLSATW
jgi:hypothetical protein